MSLCKVIKKHQEETGHPTISFIISCSIYIILHFWGLVKKKTRELANFLTTYEELEVK